MNIENPIKNYLKHPKVFLIKLPSICVYTFILFNALAMILYAGGTYFDAANPTYSITKNFFSDLGRSVTYSGQENWLSFFLFNSCVSFAGVVFILFYLHFNRLFIKDKKNRALAIIGTFFCILGSLCLIGVALTPANLLYDPHNFCSKWTFRLFFPGTLCYAIALFRSTNFNNKMAYAYLSWAFLVITYVLVSELGPPSTQSNAALVFQVVSQKLIVLTFVVNILYQTAEIKKIFKS